MPIPTTNVDSPTDKLKDARVDVKETIDTVNALSVSFVQMAVSLITTQTIVVEHHAFS